jgi:uncharacterized protein (DUF1697 family)
MTVWVGLLKGVNVGGNNILPMKEFARILQRAGLEDVSTYIQSGNVVFRSADGKRAELAVLISDIIKKKFGFRPNAFVLKASELKTIVRRNPYPDAAREPKSLHVFLLTGAPEESGIVRLAELAAGTESFRVIGKTLYLHAPDGLARSKLASAIGKTLRVDATARNWRTVGKLLEMVLQIS